MKIFKPGTDVLIATDIFCTVNEVLLSSNERVEYKVSWFEGRTRKSEWVEAHELKPINDTQTEKTQIGYR